MLRNLLLPHSGTNCAFKRNPAFESLERRDLLAAGPRVVGVEVASTAWAPAFVQYLSKNNLGTKGYAIPLGSSAQSDSLTWTNLNQIRIKFNTDVVLNSADLSVSGVNNTAYAFSAFRYDPGTHWATWTLVTPIDSDRLQLDLDANGVRPVRDSATNLLDGEWTNNSSTVSGNGTAGGDFEFRFNVQPTDVNNSSNVTSADYNLIHQQLGQSKSDSGYNPKLDIDGSGLIESDDEQAAIDRYYETLPTGSPAGVFNDAPTTTTFGLSHVDDASPELSVGLNYGFADAENGSNGLTYSIQSVSDPSLLGTLSVNQSTHRLVMSAANGAVGRATITVRATDAGGLYVDTPVNVDVNRENEPPVIDVFYSTLLVEGTRHYTGHVYDPDDTITEISIYVDGDLFATRCGVDENGEFGFAVILDVEAMGYEHATAYDPWGLASVVSPEDWGGFT